MNKTELENAIKNGESVWVVDLKNKIITENKRHKHFKKLLATQRENRIPFDRIFTTRRQAEHYLHHANVSRIEHLPFLTWEEFLEKKEISFKDYQDYNVYLHFTNNNKNITLFCINPEHKDQYFDATEANFYKAYDECVKLFRGFD